MTSNGHMRRRSFRASWHSYHSSAFRAADRHQQRRRWIRKRVEPTVKWQDVAEFRKQMQKSKDLETKVWAGKTLSTLEEHLRMAESLLTTGCGGRMGAGSVDAARAACLEAARRKGDAPIETENVRVIGDGRYEMSVRNKGTLGSSVTTCTYDKNIGAAIK